jgi:flagellin
MRINQNIMAFNAYRNLASTQGVMAKSLEKLSSGYRINRAADDASGLVISQGLRAQVSGLRQATRNAQDGVSVVQTAEGALNEVHGMLNRVRDLIVQSANTASSDANARQAAQNEISQLRSEIDRIAGTTALAGTGSGVVVGAVASVTFDLTVDTGGTSTSVTVTVTSGTYLTTASLQANLEGAISTALNVAGFTGAVSVDVRDLGSGAWAVDIARNSTNANTGIKFSNVGSAVRGVTAGTFNVSNVSGGTFQVGANVAATDQISLSIADLRITSGTTGAFTALSGIDVTNTANNATAQSLIDAAITKVSDIRGSLGAVQNRFESTIANLQVTTENLAASESRIRDTDMALEMVSFTRHQVLMQAGTAMLAQANSAPQSVLRLLQ